MSDTKVVTEYVHGGPEARDEYSDLWDYDAEQQEIFHYVLYEEPVKIEVHLPTGKYRYLEFSGHKLEDPKWYPGKTDEP